ncbi:hypothetical protein GGF32_005095 [Allomyces javanicus]|nr:hypothetical protein GGF32_005095 [Allomyces javanicus]
MSPVRLNVFVNLVTRIPSTQMLEYLLKCSPRANPARQENVMLRYLRSDARCRLAKDLLCDRRVAAADKNKTMRRRRRTGVVNDWEITEWALDPDLKGCHGGGR